MTENNATQPGLTDDDILQVFSDVVGNQEDDARFIDVDRDQAIRIARALLSRYAAALASAPVADEPKCLRCNGTGEADSGGIHPWGAPALIPCECTVSAPVAGEARPEKAVSISQLADLVQSEDVNREQPGFHWRKGWNEALYRCMDLASAAPQADKDGGDCAKGAGKWPMLSELHLHALMFAYNEGYSKAYDGRVFPNPFSENGSQAAAWQLGTDDGTEARAAQHPRTDGGGRG